MVKKTVTVQKGTKIVVGYRSLIDWYKTGGNWSGWTTSEKRLADLPTRWGAGHGGTTGPQAIPGKGAKLPGAKGAAWNVENFNVPTTTMVKGKRKGKKK